MIDLGDTSSEEYQLVYDKINDITIALDPSKFPKIDLGEMIQTEGMENKIKMVIQSGSEAGKKVAEGYAVDSPEVKRRFRIFLLMVRQMRISTKQVPEKFYGDNFMQVDDETLFKEGRELFKEMRGKANENT